MNDPVSQTSRSRPAIEWPTLALLAAVLAAWAGLTVWAEAIGPWPTALLLALVLAQHSSLQHELLHGHPFADQRLNDALGFPALGLFVPYHRFRDTHLAHHHDPNLTDPYDDPESNYLDPAVWARLPRPLRGLLIANNTLLGRMLIGPLVGMGCFVGEDVAAMRDRAVIRAWALHLAGVVPVVLWLAAVGTVPAWAYLLGCYGALSLLRIRTFLEHQAHERHGARSVIIEDRGPLALLFLNNNLHAVHHAHPGLAWYRLPGEYARRRAEFLARNGGYRYRSYAEVFRRYLLARKDPVPHPLYPVTPASPGE
jgi:fatty acid desaturase